MPNRGDDLNINATNTDLKIFISLLEIVRREGDLLRKTDARLFKEPLDSAWADRLLTDEDLAERLGAFVSRFGRMQDTIGDKLVPSLLRLLTEKPGSVLDNLNRAEKLGFLASVIEWLDVRNLRNKLVHEYVTDPMEFVMALNQSHTGVTLLVATYNGINLLRGCVFQCLNGRICYKGPAFSTGIPPTERFENHCFWPS